MTDGANLSCLNCRRGFAKVRGLCNACDRRLRRQIKAGLTTWAELEAADRARPAKPRTVGARLRRMWEDFAGGGKGGEGDG